MAITNGYKRDRYRAISIAYLEDQRDRLLAMANNTKFTPGTRSLAMKEADYVSDVIAYRNLPRQEHRSLIERGIAPWFNNWTRES